jgi:hypothetical protein
MALKSSLSWMGAFAIGIALFTTGCAATAHVQKDKSADFSKYKTYAWVEKTESKGNKANRRHNITEQNIRASVDEQLQKNGWRESKSNPDVLVNYELLVEKNQREQRDAVYSQPFTRSYFNRYTGRYNTFYYPSQFMGYDSYSTTVREGTVTITMIDNKTDRTVFQGWATNDISRGNLSERQIDNNVKSIFKKFETGK